MVDAPPPPPELRTVKLSTVIHRVVDKSYRDLLSVCQGLEEKSDRDRKLALRTYFQNARNRLIKLLVLIKWSAHVPAVKTCWELEQFLVEQDASLEGAAARLFNFMGTIKDARAPNYDIPTAIDVLTTGTYSRLPTAIKNVIPPAPLTEGEEKEILKRLGDIISMRLFHSKLPSQFTVSVENGRVYLKVKNEFEVSLTVHGEDTKLTTEASQVKRYPWIVLGIDLFISSSVGVKEATDSLFPPRFMHALRDRLQQRMARAEHPLEELYTIMHAVCAPLQIGVLATQAQVLSRRLAPDVKVEYVPEKELRVFYWRDLATTKYAAQAKREGPEVEWPIYLQIVVDERQITVSHTPTIYNPVSGDEIQLVVRSTSLNLEQLFQQAVQYHSYSLLFTLQEVLFADSKLGLFIDDVRLITANQGRHTYLKIRLFHPQYLFVSIDLRSGRFLLKAPVGMADQETVNPLEAKLNKDSNAIPSIVRELRLKTLLHHFSRIASAESLRLEVFHELLKAPAPPTEVEKDEQHTFSANTLFLRFRDVSDFFLAIELDEQDFSPKFYLLVTKKTAPSALVQIQQVVPLADALSKSSPFLVPSLPSSASSLFMPPATPFSTLSTPMASPYHLMSPSPLPSPVSFLHEQASIPADIARQIKQEREMEREQSEVVKKRTSKGKEKESEPSTPPESSSAKRKLDNMETGGEEGGKTEGSENKRTKQVSSSSVENRVLPYQSLLSSLVSNCRKTITSLLMRRFFEESKGISYKNDESGDLVFTIPLNDTKMPISQMRICFLGDFRWAVIVEESKPTFTFLVPYLNASRKLLTKNNVTYEPGRGWRFEYDHITEVDSLKIFLRDLRVVTRITALGNGVESVFGNPAKYEHLIRYFELDRFTPSLLTLRFDEGRRHMCIRISEEASFEITWSGFDGGAVLPFFQFMLNARRNISDLLEAVYRTHASLHLINSFLHTPTAGGYLLTNDFALVPRDVTHVRLIYKNTLGVDLRILPNSLVHIEDASTPSTAGIPTGLTGMHRRHQLLPLTNFAAFYNEHLLPLVGSMLPRMPLSQQGMQPSTTGLLTRDTLTKALDLLHQFMASLNLYRHAGAILKNEGFEDVKAEKPHKLVFTANKQNFSVTIVNHISIGLHAKAKQHQSSAFFGAPKAPPEPVAELSEEECGTISRFFQRQVAMPPFRHAVSHMTALLRLVALPLPVLQEFVHLMKKENEQGFSRQGMGLRWFLASPPLFSGLPAGQPAVIHDKAAGVVSFVVGFAWKANARAGLGLQWRYQERTWSGWGVPEQSPGSAALRQLLSSVPVDAPEGPLAAVIGALEKQSLDRLLAMAGLDA